MKDRVSGGRRDWLAVAALAATSRLWHLLHLAAGGDEAGLLYWPVLAARRFEECAEGICGAGGSVSGVFSYASPLYVLLISPAYAAGCGRMCVYAVQAAMCAAVAVVIHGIALRAGSGRIPAAIAALAWILYAPAAFYELTLLPVVPLALLLGLWSGLEQGRGDSGGRRRCFVSGLLCGAAAGLRPPLLLLAAYPFFGEAGGRRLSRALLVAAGAALPLAVLSLLHLSLEGDPYPFPRATGVNLVLGHSEGVTGLGPPAPAEGLVETGREDIHQVAARVAAQRGYDTPGEADRYWTGRALRWIAENPGEELALLAAKLGGFLGWRQFDVYYDTVRARGRDPSLAPLFLPRWAVVLLLALGLPAFLAAGRGRWALLLPMGITLAAALVFVHCERYWLPALPSALAAAAAGLTVLRRWVVSGRLGRVLTAATAAGVLMLPGLLWPVPAVPECQYLRGMAVRAYNAGDYRHALTLYERSALLAPRGSVTSVYSRYEALRISRALGMEDRAREHARILGELLRESGMEPPLREAMSIDSLGGGD